MNTFLTIYDKLKTIVSQVFRTLKFKEREHPKGRKSILSNSETVTCAILWRKQDIGSKKSLYEILEPPLSYNRFVVALNRTAKYLAAVVTAVMKSLRKNSQPVKFTDSTDIPVCQNKNASRHQTMKGLAAWSKTSKGLFYGLKLHLSADFQGKVLALKFTSGNSNDRAIFRKMNEKLRGLFVADAGYVGEEFERSFFVEGKRMVITGSRKNMKKLSAPWQIALLNLRMRVEIHFRILKVCYGLVTSLPRSIDGYLTHYLAAVAAHLLA
ncbi:MAG: IS982 family transposase [Candidatus Yonathbacteria bacterium]|nr:IS982 family transposase [Candidatus Yonathbacteria bacterium]